MCLAVAVQSGRRRIVPEADRAVLVRDSSQRELLSNEQVACKQALVALMPVNRALLLLQQALQFRLQPLLTLQIVWRVSQNDLAVAVQRHSIVRIWKVFGCQPEVQ